MSKEELFEGLSEEQITKARECESPEELLNLAKEQGVELNEEQLEAVSGGGCGGSNDDDGTLWSALIAILRNTSKEFV